MRSLRRLGRRVLLVIGAAPLAVILAIVLIAGYALVSPYSSVPVTACDGAALAATTEARVTVEGLGAGIRVASHGSSEIIAVLGPGGTVTGGLAVLRVGGRVVTSLPVRSRTVDGAIADGVAYLFDDTIGFLIDAQTGVPIARIFESDNYRGLFSDGNGDRVQTSIEATAVGFGGRPFFTATLPMGAVVDACLLATP